MCPFISRKKIYCRQPASVHLDSWANSWSAEIYPSLAAVPAAGGTPTVGGGTCRMAEYFPARPQYGQFCFGDPDFFCRIGTSWVLSTHSREEKFQTFL